MADKPDSKVTGKGIAFRNDTVCLNTTGFKVDLNIDNNNKDSIELLNKFYNLRYDENLTKEEKTAKFKEILNKYREQA